jgi:hypothetical protein
VAHHGRDGGQVRPFIQKKHCEAMPPRVRVQVGHFGALAQASDPAVYARLRDMALAMRRRGVARWGFRAAWEILRWQGMLSTTDGQYKLPNNLAPHYARLLMEREPELAGFFETRQLRRA